MTSQDKPGSLPPSSVPPGSSGNFNFNQQGGVNNQIFINKEDNSPRRRMRDLFNQVDPNILDFVQRGESTLRVRMQPFEISELQNLIKEAGSNSDVMIKAVGGPIIDSTINNGSLGTTRSVHEQHAVLITVSSTILLRTVNAQ